MTKQEIKDVFELLDYLDGRGIVFEDEDLVKRALKEYTPQLIALYRTGKLVATTL